MQRVLAISWLTLKAAFRYRLVLVLAALLLGSVIALPLIIKDDGTARGFTQILLTYTLTLTTTLLGFSTLWLSCGTLARDIEEAQLQLVAVKPIGRWQIWLGKWFGVLALNAILLTLAGAAIFFLLQYRAHKLPAKQQAVLQNEVLVARGSIREPLPNYEADIERVFQERLKSNAQTATQVDRPTLHKMVEEQVKASYQVVPPDYRREWKVPLGFLKNRLKDRPLYLRIKFNAAQPSPNGNYLGLWEVGVPESPQIHRTQMNLAADTFHEFEVPPNLFSDTGILTVNFINRNPTALLFSFEEGLEVLYREGGFGLNFVRGLFIIFFWLSFLAALALCSATFLSFPVAAFVSLGVLFVGLSGGTLTQVIEQGGVSGINHETGVAENPGLLDRIAIPMASGLLTVINLIQGFSPIDSLSSGRSVSWSMLGQAFLQICVLLSGLMAAIGIVILNRRELATAQGAH